MTLTEEQKEKRRKGREKANFSKFLHFSGYEIDKDQYQYRVTKTAENRKTYHPTLEGAFQRVLDHMIKDKATEQGGFKDIKQAIAAILEARSTLLPQACIAID